MWILSTYSKNLFQQKVLIYLVSTYAWQNMSFWQDFIITSPCWHSWILKSLVIKYWCIFFEILQNKMLKYNIIFHLSSKLKIFISYFKIMSVSHYGFNGSILWMMPYLDNNIFIIITFILLIFSQTVLQLPLFGLM